MSAYDYLKPIVVNEEIALTCDWDGRYVDSGGVVLAPLDVIVPSHREYMRGMCAVVRREFPYGPVRIIGYVALTDLEICYLRGEPFDGDGRLMLDDNRKVVFVDKAASGHAGNGSAPRA